MPWGYRRAHHEGFGHRHPMVDIPGMGLMGVQKVWKILLGTLGTAAASVMLSRVKMMSHRALDKLESAKPMTGSKPRGGKRSKFTRPKKRRKKYRGGY